MSTCLSPPWRGERMAIRHHLTVRLAFLRAMLTAEYTISVGGVWGWLCRE